MNARTPYLKLLSASTMALLVILVAGYLMSEPASAQRIPPPSDPVLAAVQDVQRSIGGLQANANALQASLDAHIAPSHFRWTPAVNAVYDRLTCLVVNISGVQQTIHIELKKGDGSNETEDTVDVAPGATGEAGTLNRDGLFHCKFTVIGGTRADIRAALLGSGSIRGSGLYTGHSFQIPAE